MLNVDELLTLGGCVPTKLRDFAGKNVESGCGRLCARATDSRTMQIHRTVIICHCMIKPIRYDNFVSTNHRPSGPTFTWAQLSRWL